MASVAVITIARGRHEHLRRQQRSLSVAHPPPDDVVLVAMGDPVVADWPATGGVVPLTVSVPAEADALPLAAARNTGARVAVDSGADVLVFLDVDCLAGPDLVSGYADAVAHDPGRIWSGPVTYLPPGLDEDQLAAPWLLDDPHPARPAPAPGDLLTDADPDLFWSLSFALHRDAWLTAGGFCEDYVGYGGEDTDFAQQAAARGLGFGWVGDARAYHQHHPTQDPPVQHVDDILRNAAVFHARWGRWPMLGWLEAFADLGLVERSGDGWHRVRAEAGSGA